MVLFQTVLQIQIQVVERFQILIIQRVMMLQIQQVHQNLIRTKIQIHRNQLLLQRVIHSLLQHLI